jgi:hypothetical protein
MPNFFWAEKFPGAVTFDHADLDLGNSFVGCEAFLALLALATAADDETILASTRVNDFVVIDVTKRTFHNQIFRPTAKLRGSEGPRIALSYPIRGGFGKSRAIFIEKLRNILRPVSDIPDRQGSRATIGWVERFVWIAKILMKTKSFSETILSIGTGVSQAGVVVVH